MSLKEVLLFSFEEIIFYLWGWRSSQFVRILNSADLARPGSGQCLMLHSRGRAEGRDWRMEWGVRSLLAFQWAAEGWEGHQCVRGDITSVTSSYKLNNINESEAEEIKFYWLIVSASENIVQLFKIIFLY